MCNSHVQTPSGEEQQPGTLAPPHVLEECPNSWRYVKGDILYCRNPRRASVSSSSSSPLLLFLLLLLQRPHFCVSPAGRRFTGRTFHADFLAALTHFADPRCLCGLLRSSWRTLAAHLRLSTVPSSPEHTRMDPGALQLLLLLVSAEALLQGEPRQRRAAARGTHGILELAPHLFRLGSVVPAFSAVF